MVIKENYSIIKQSELKFNVEQNNETNFHSNYYVAITLRKIVLKSHHKGDMMS